MPFFDSQMENRDKQWQIPVTIGPFVSTASSAPTILEERK